MKAFNRMAFLATVSCLAVPHPSWATYKWIGPDGGLWSDLKNWQDEKVAATALPTATTDVNLPSGARTIVIDRDDCVCNRFSIDPGSAASDCPIVLSGAGKLTVAGAGATSYVWADRKVTLQCRIAWAGAIECHGHLFVESPADVSYTQAKDVMLKGEGASFIVNGGRFAFYTIKTTGTTNGKVEVNGGELIDYSSNWVYPTEGCPFVVNGGTFRSAIDLRETGARFVQNGGTVINRYTPNFNAAAADGGFELNGGRFVYNSVQLTDMRLLRNIKTGLTLETPYSASGAVMNPAAIDGDVITIDGMVVATNGASSSYMLATAATLRGDGTLIASRFTPNAKDKTVTLKLGELVLGAPNNDPKYGLYVAKTGMTIAIPGGIAFGSHGDWEVYLNCNPTVSVSGLITLDTLDYFDRASTHRIALKNLVADMTTSFAVRGGGTGELAFRQTPRLNALTVEKDSVLTLSDPARAERMALASGARLNLVGEKARLECSGAEIAPDAQIVIASDAARATGWQPILTFRPGSDEAETLVSSVVVSGAGYGARAPVTVNGSVFLTGDVTNVQATAEWTGAANGFWSNVGNWTGQTPPANGQIAYFGGLVNTTVTNDLEGSSFASLSFSASAAPYRLTGRSLTLTSSANNTDKATVFSLSRFPVVIENDLMRTGNFGAVSARDSYVELAGVVSVDSTFSYIGDVRVSGTVDCADLSVQYASAIRDESIPYDSCLYVLPGGQVRALAQTTLQQHTLPYRVGKGGVLSIAGTQWGWASGRNGNGIYVEGLMDVSAPLGGYGKMTYTGSGRVNFRGGNGQAKASFPIRLVGQGEGLTCGLVDWHTVTGQAVPQLLPIEVSGRVKLVALDDVAYGPADVSHDWTPAERALKLAEDSTLTVQTSDEDLDEPVARTVAFADPIVGTGALVVKGSGKVVLASADNDIGGGVTVESGTLVLAVSQELAGFSVASGAKLTFVSPDGEPTVLTTDSNIDLSNVTFDLGKCAQSTAWTTVLVTSGKLTGIPVVAEHHRARIVVSANGSEVQIREKRGLCVIVR